MCMLHMMTVHHAGPVGWSLVVGAGELKNQGIQYFEQQFESVRYESTRYRERTQIFDQTSMLRISKQDEKKSSFDHAILWHWWYNSQKPNSLSISASTVSINSYQHGLDEKHQPRYTRTGSFKRVLEPVV